MRRAPARLPAPSVPEIGPALPANANTMNYTLLIYETSADFSVRSDTGRKDEYWAAWKYYSQAVKDAGIFVGGAGLQPPGTATTLGFKDGQRWVQDGPFADSKEQLAGFYIINVPDLDVALEWAARCPRSPTRVVEVRPNLPPGY